MGVSGVIAVIVAIALSRMINERAYRQLNDDEKIRLMDGFSRARSYSMIPLLLLIGIYYGLMYYVNLDKGVLTLIFFGLLIIYILIRTLMNYLRLIHLAMPIIYRRLFVVSQIVSLFGCAWFFYTLISTMFADH